MSNRPIIVQYKQNDASVETENYLRNKRWVIENVQRLQREIKQQYQTLENDRLELSQRTTLLKNKCTTLFQKTYLLKKGISQNHFIISFKNT